MSIESLWMHIFNKWSQYCLYLKQKGVKFRFVTYTCCPLLRSQRNGLVIVWIGVDGLTDVHTPASIWFLLLKWNFFLIDCRRCTAVLSSVWQSEIVYTCALGSYESKCWNASPQIRWSIHSVLSTLSYLHGVIYMELSTRSYLHGVIYIELSTYTVNQTYQ